LEFSDGYTWDRNDWEPEHLLLLPDKSAALLPETPEEPQKKA
jgi:hypothetical protein